MKISVSKKLEICKKTREIAAKTLYQSLKELLESKKRISEIDLRDEWLLELRKHKEIFPEGWYNPPPLGFIILFGDKNHIQRLYLKSARPVEFWPKDNIYLDQKEGVASMYFSPVNKQAGIIGDFGLTVYLGSNKDIKKHLCKVFNITKEIFNYIKLEMKFSDICKFAINIAGKNDLTNDIVSISDPSNTNIGHTIPAIYEEWTNQEKKNLKTRNIEVLANTISKKRKFLNLVEQTKVQPGMAFTIEPRLLDKKDRKLPMAYFHTIVLIKENGQKELLTGFNDIFRLTGMNYMLTTP